MSEDVTFSLASCFLYLPANLILAGLKTTSWESGFGHVNDAAYPLGSTECKKGPSVRDVDWERAVMMLSYLAGEYFCSGHFCGMF